MRRLFVAVSISALAIGGSSACATKKFVRTSVGEVNEKVDAMGKSLEETQERTRQNEGRIAAVDQKADQATQSARQAYNAAGEAHNAANAAASKADAVDRASKRLIYEVVLSEDEGNFRFGKSVLPNEAKARLDEMIAQIKADPKGAYFEVEGHTDNIGDKKVNERIGLERAQAVKRYLYEQHQVPLHKINVISYGEEKPVAPNKTKAGRAQNRRVVIKVLV
jgi:outer membrane protein OmpA-like peptidoglycan-associated protein